VRLLLALALTSTPVFASAATAAVCSQPGTARLIVQAQRISLARVSVEQVGGTLCRELAVIDGVSATLTDEQANALRARPDLRVFADRAVSSLGKISSLLTQSTAVYTDGTAVTGAANKLSSSYRVLVSADQLQQARVTGKDVTIAVLDSGFWTDAKDGIKGRVLASVDTLRGAGKVEVDPYGHGTHVASIAAGSFGIAPEAQLVIVRAFDAYGSGSYSDVIAGLDWILANRVKYKIRVLNLSFGAQPQSNYWDDPLNQAVMKAWQAGIVVVTAAGNEGPLPMTIGVPGNVPYVITVGAQTDNYTPFNAWDDRLASFSSAGPTYEGFIKPEIVAPGGHMVGSMSYQSYLANLDPGSMRKDDQLFTMSGTSQAAAVTSGIVALMIQSDPSLTPDVVKCRLMASASPATTMQGRLAYSLFQQGAGLVNAVKAVANSATGCANQGLDIAADLAGSAHFGGPANRDAFGNYYVMNLEDSEFGSLLPRDGTHWSQGFTWDEGFTWSNGYTWSKGFTWSKGYTWSKSFTGGNGFVWGNGYTWSKTLPWWDTKGPMISTAKPASIASWVSNQ
jgi:serine protease AprX